MISITGKSSIIQAVVFIVSLIAITIVPLNEGVIAVSLAEGVTGGVTGEVTGGIIGGGTEEVNWGVTQSIYPSSTDKESWWETWPGDLNKNKIDIPLTKDQVPVYISIVIVYMQVRKGVL